MKGTLPVKLSYNITFGYFRTRLNATSQQQLKVDESNFHALNEYHVKWDNHREKSHF